MRFVEKCWDDLSGEACVFLLVVAMLCLTLLVGVAPCALSSAGDGGDMSKKDPTEEEHVRAVASERAHAARHMFNFLESINAPTEEKSVALEEESYWWGVYDRGAFDE